MTKTNERKEISKILRMDPSIYQGAFDQTINNGNDGWIIYKPESNALHVETIDHDQIDTHDQPRDQRMICQERFASIECRPSEINDKVSKSDNECGEKSKKR